MPPVSKKPAAGNTAKDRPIIYPELRVNGVVIPTDRVKLNYDQLVKIIGWEDEPTYQQRVAGATGDPASVPGFGDAFTLKDEYGNKVRLHNNDMNRPFDEGTSDKYLQDTLDKAWAGYEMKDVENPTVNGETIIVSRTGQTLSGQHRITGAIRAIQRWRKCRGEKYPQWTEEPFLESLVVTGVSDDQRVVATLDNVRPRTLADTIYTSPIFRKYKSNVYRAQLSTMLDKAIDTLWKRTAAKEYAFHEVQTHAASFDFLARHPKLRDAVVKVFEEDKGDVKKNEDKKNLVGYAVGLGNFAAALYLMATAASDPDEYVKKGRKEKHLDFAFWQRAVDFISALAADEDSPLAEELRHLRKAMEALIDADDTETMGGRVIEKLAVLAAAWNEFGEEKPVKPSHLKLEYIRNDEGVATKIADPATFGGIDFGPYPTPGGGKEQEGDKEAVADARAEKEAATVAKLTGADSAVSADTVEAQVEGIRQQNKGRTLIFQRDTGLTAFGVDAKPVADALELKVVKRPNGGYEQVTIPGTLDDAAAALRIKGLKVAVVTFDDRGGAKVEDLKAPFAGATPKEKPAAAPKPAASKNGTGNGKPAAGKKLRGGVNAS